MTQSYDSLLRNYCRYAAIEQLHLSILVFLLVLLSANENLIKMANLFIFENARFHPLIGQPIRIHTDWLSNRKGAQYLKMLKGISVCLLDTFLIVIYWIWKYFTYLDSFCTVLFEYRYSRLLSYLSLFYGFWLENNELSIWKVIDLAPSRCGWVIKLLSRWRYV